MTDPVKVQSYKVVLEYAGGRGGRVVFEASAPLSENRSANYAGMDITHLPSEMFSYKNTSARHFNITGKLISRNKQEASQNSYYCDLIRTWILPDFGRSGATPPILWLSAYKNNNINRVPCVLNSYTINFPDEVDWIFEGDNPMPIIGSISVDLTESYSAKQITGLMDSNKKIYRPWHIKLGKQGSFVNGESYKDATASSGNITPDILDLPDSGLAVVDSIVTKETSSSSQPDSFGIKSSGSIVDKSPIKKDSYNLHPSTKQASPNIVVPKSPNSLGRDSNKKVKLPTSVN